MSDRKVVYSRHVPGLTAIKLGDVDHNGAFVAEVDEKFLGDEAPQGRSPFKAVLAWEHFTEHKPIECALPAEGYALVSFAEGYHLPTIAGVFPTRAEALNAAEDATHLCGIVPISIGRVITFD